MKKNEQKKNKVKQNYLLRIAPPGNKDTVVFSEWLGQQREANDFFFFNDVLVHPYDNKGMIGGAWITKTTALENAHD